jgi:hypothetical protein
MVRISVPIERAPGSTTAKPELVEVSPKRKFTAMIEAVPTAAVDARLINSVTFEKGPP